MKLPLTASWVDCPFRYTFEHVQLPDGTPTHFYMVLHVLIPPYRPQPPFFDGSHWWHGIVWKKLDREEFKPDEGVDFVQVARENPHFHTWWAALLDHVEKKAIVWAEKNWPYAIFDNMEGGGG